MPKHVLEAIEPSQLRTDSFNTAHPVGSGPFKWDAIEVFGRDPGEREERIGLLPFADYHLGAPKLQRLALRAFRNQDKMLEAFNKREINAMVGLDDVPVEFTEDIAIHDYSVPVTGSVMTFFNNQNNILSDQKVRQALVMAVDRKDVRESLGFPVIPSESPFLHDQFSFNKDLVQLGTNRDEANRLLDEAGWSAKGSDGIRIKGEQPLKFRLLAQKTAEFSRVAENLKQQWRAVGVDLAIEQPSDDEFKSALALHSYDALLYGISIGADPDVFAFWHSSQADPRATTQLNFSQYKSSTADTALEGGRTRADSGLRVVKYKPFLEAWRNDAPALALYQPRFLYVTRGQLYNFEPSKVNSAIDRYNNVHNWMVRQTKSNK